MVKIKTLIELFDKCQIENAISGLRFNPEKIVFVGFKEVMTNRRQKALMNFFAMRKLNIKFEFEIVGRYDFEAIVERLNYILDTNEDCYFDLTGGKEIVLTAMGFVSQKRNVPMLQINVKSGDIIKVKNCDNLVETEKSAVFIKESVILNGCSVINDESNDFCWNLDNDFKADLEVIWNIAKINCGLWNKQSTVLANFEKFGRIDEEFRVTVNLKHLEDCKQEVFLNKRILHELVQNGLIFDFVMNEDILTFKYKNSRVHQCISKAGNILELYSYMLLKEINEEETGYYDDIDIGVYIDWDGVTHDTASKEKDTKNEIDIMLMRDLVPVFISCKNGEVLKEALYELSTVAEKFGGKYAKKILISTYVSSDDDKKSYIKRRAADMNITLIEGIEHMDRESIKKIFKVKIK